MASLSNGSAAATVDDAMNRMISSATYSSSNATYIPSNAWQGPRPGYYFGTREEKTGYYRDAALSGTFPAVSDQEAAATSHAGAAKQQQQQQQRRPKKGEDLLAEAEERLKMTSAKKRKLNNVEWNSKSGIQSALASLERSIERNAMQRVKFDAAPEQYMESELALYDELVSLQSLAATDNIPLVYEALLEESSSGNTMVSLWVGLLTHENTDMVLQLLQIWVELLDPSLLQLQDESSGVAMGSLAQQILGTALDGMMANLGRFGLSQENDDEEAKGLDHILNLVEYLMELDVMGWIQKADTRKNGTAYDSVTKRILRETTLLSWLLEQVMRRVDGNSSFLPIQLHASEVLATLLQHEDATSQGATSLDLAHLTRYESALVEDDKEQTLTPKKKLVDGMEWLLQAVAPWRKKDPSTEEQVECMENCWDALAAAVWKSPRNQESFMEAQGVELLLRCIRERRHSGCGALRVLSNLTSMSTQASETLVELHGLKTLVPVYMGRTFPKPASCTPAGRAGATHKKAKRAKREWMQGIESHILQVMYSLTRYLTDASPHDVKQRLVAKFLESDLEKCDRLVELLVKYDEMARLAEYKYYKSDEAEEAEQLGLDVDLAALAAKLKNGGALFHRLGAIAAFVSLESKRCHEHILEQLQLKQSGIGVIKVALEEFATGLEDGEQKNQLVNYLSAI